MYGSRIGAGLVLAALLATASPVFAQRGGTPDADGATTAETSMPAMSPCTMGQQSARQMGQQAGRQMGQRMGSSAKAGQMRRGGGMMQGSMRTDPDETPLAERTRLEQMQAHMVDRMRRMAVHMRAIQDRLAELDAEGDTP